MNPDFETEVDALKAQIVHQEKEHLFLAEKLAELQRERDEAFVQRQEALTAKEEAALNNQVDPGGHPSDHMSGRPLATADAPTPPPPAAVPVRPGELLYGQR